MVVQNGRALHFVFKIADRAKTAKFYMSVLGMKVGNFVIFKADKVINNEYYIRQLT